MNLRSRYFKVLYVVVAIADLLAFSRVTGLSLMATGIGTALVFLGIIYHDRNSGIIGVLIVAVAAAGSVYYDDFTQSGQILSGIVGTLAPVFALTWIALAAPEREEEQSRLPRASILVSTAYILVSIWAAPLCILAIGIMVPSLSIRVGTMTQGAIVLLVAVTGGVLLTYRTEEPTRAGAGD